MRGRRTGGTGGPVLSRDPWRGARRRRVRLPNSRSRYLRKSRPRTGPRPRVGRFHRGDPGPTALGRSEADPAVRVGVVHDGVDVLAVDRDVERALADVRLLGVHKSGDVDGERVGVPLGARRDGASDRRLAERPPLAVLAHADSEGRRRADPVREEFGHVEVVRVLGAEDDAELPSSRVSSTSSV